MTTIKETRDKLNETLKELDKHIEPEKREYEYFLGVDGSVYNIGVRQPKDYTNLIIAQGNAFYTREEAERERDKRTLIVKMRDEFGFEPDWGKESREQQFSRKYVILCYFNNPVGFQVESVTCGSGYGVFGIYFETREKARACIDKYGDDIKRVLGV